MTVTLYTLSAYQEAYNVILSLSIDPNQEDAGVVDEVIGVACYGVPDSAEAADSIHFCRLITAKVLCSDCGERTLSVATPADVDAAALRLCLPCYDKAGLENEHSDGYHSDGCPEGCPA